MRYLILFIILITNARADIVEKLRSVNDYKIITSEALKQKTITKPMGAWIHLMDFKGSQNSCLFYKTPYKNEAGVLKLLKKSGETCDENTVWWYQGGVRKLGILAGSTVTLSYVINDLMLNFTLGFINRLYTKQEYKLFDPPQKKKNLTGLHLLQ